MNSSSPGITQRAKQGFVKDSLSNCPTNSCYSHLETFDHVVVCSQVPVWTWPRISYLSAQGKCQDDKPCYHVFKWLSNGLYLVFHLFFVSSFTVCHFSTQCVWLIKPPLWASSNCTIPCYINYYDFIVTYWNSVNPRRPVLMPWKQLIFDWSNSFRYCM